MRTRTMAAASSLREGGGLSIAALLRPHAAALAVGFLAVIGESFAGLLEPWPLKLVFDHVSKSKSAAHGRLAMTAYRQ